ncbi:MAG: glycoside hydrolase family 3 protein [Firmicutes bacterium]|jgi:beta-N-acetylhexosaminidase|nr:glycoside hydrolase family 3 protein [Bacillota bacterium]
MVSILESMTLEQKVGQMFMAGFPDEFQGALPDSARHLISRRFIGGFVAVARNARTPLVMKALTLALQREARDSGALAPLFIMSDYEGGIVMPIAQGVCTFPGPMATCATGDLDLARDAARVMGIEARAMGISIVASPVVDVNLDASNPIIGVRAFSDDPGQVCAFTEATVSGYCAAGVIAVAKHFPGHGRTCVDSHESLPHLDVSASELQQVELAPFQAAVSSGVPMIMTAHIACEAFDSRPNMPATLSRPILTGLLRQQMGFDGLIITDCLEMRAVRDLYGPGEAAVASVIAGADIVLLCHTLTAQEEAIRCVLEAVQSGLIPEARIDESVLRILRAKSKWLGGFDSALEGYGLELGMIGSPESRALEECVARSSVTVVRNDRKVLPVAIGQVGSVAVVYPETMPLLRAEDLLDSTSVLADSLRARCARVIETRFRLDPTDEDIACALASAHEADIVIAATSCKTQSHQAAQARMVHALLRTGRPVVAIAIRNPYDILAYPEVDTYLVTYGYRECSIKAAVEVILGDITPKGRLPVAIPGLYPRGHGLSDGWNQ